VTDNLVLEERLKLASAMLAALNVVGTCQTGLALWPPGSPQHDEIRAMLAAATGVAHAIGDRLLAVAGAPDVPPTSH
jgi:hypothetical protein